MTAGIEPWRSDGTKHGTWLVRDINSGRKGSRPADFVAAGSRVFFGAYDKVHGRELWVYPAVNLGHEERLRTEASALTPQRRVAATAPRSLDRKHR